MILSDDEYLAHYGILRKSGRYPWGSGSTQSQRNRSFLDTVDDLLKNKGMSEAEVARGFDMSVAQLRALRSIAVNQQKAERIRQAERLRDKGMSVSAIGRQMGMNESSVRSLLTSQQKDKADILESTSNMLRRQVDQKGFIDIGTQVERSLPLGDNPASQIGISKTKFDTAVAVLREEGYVVHTVNVQQLGTGEMTKMRVLAKPGVSQKEVWENRHNIKQIQEKSPDHGRTYEGIRPPTSVNSKKVDIRYAEDGGTDADGVIYVRPGVKDLDLGASRYAQVRIAVDGTHYLKGVAVYKDDLPAGVDLVFNTNKSNTGNKKDAMKEMNKTPDGKIDMENPFSSSIKPGGQRGHLNIVNEEGDWDKWSRNLPSQMLSKQSPDLAKRQLGVTQERRRKEFDALSELTNPAVRKKLLETFAEETDSAAVHLKAAALPRQATKLLLPVSSMKEHEIYAPSFRDGERVALVRFPHGGTFEIPQLTVNNKNPQAKKMLGSNATDAVGIHHKVAERLSGADFDGDTALVIPNNRGDVKSTPALEGLKGFDPQSYKIKPGSGVKPISPRRKQQEMGNVSNLITDMTIQGANTQELARAVRHSMVVIDAEKHKLDYQASARDNGIAQLKATYQGGSRAGAKTLISRASAETRVADRKPRSAAKGGPIDKETGKKVWEPTGRTFVDRNGRTVVRTVKSTKLAEADDAHTLSSGTRVEEVYANHSNHLKSLANAARKEAVNTKPTPYSPSAKAAYSRDVASLNAKLNLALKNAPLERQAQVIANATLSQKRQANPDMDADALKKVKAQALAEARARTGAGKERIEITQSEWNAIQAGAISNHKLEQILNNSDLDSVRKLATPRQQLVMTATKQNRAAAMLAAGHTQAEVADALGVALSTLKTALSGGE